MKKMTKRLRSSQALNGTGSLVAQTSSNNPYASRKNDIDIGVTNGRVQGPLLQGGAEAEYPHHRRARSAKQATTRRMGETMKEHPM